MRIRFYAESKLAVPTKKRRCSDDVRPGAISRLSVIETVLLMKANDL